MDARDPEILPSRAKGSFVSVLMELTHREREDHKQKGRRERQCDAIILSPPSVLPSCSCSTAREKKLNFRVCLLPLEDQDLL